MGHKRASKRVWTFSEVEVIVAFGWTVFMFRRLSKLGVGTFNRVSAFGSIGSVALGWAVRENSPAGASGLSVVASSVATMHHSAVHVTH